MTLHCKISHCRINCYSASHDNWCTETLLNRVITAQWEGMGDVGAARYEPALLPPCPTIRVLSYSNCQRSTSSRAWQFKCYHCSYDTPTWCIYMNKCFIKLFNVYMVHKKERCPGGGGGGGGDVRRTVVERATPLQVYASSESHQRRPS